MASKKCVAYVSTYTMGDNHGIRIYDVDVENGSLSEKGKGPTHPHHSSPVSKGVQDQTVPGQLSCSLWHASKPGETNPNGSQTHELIKDSFKQLSEFRSSLLQ